MGAPTPRRCIIANVIVACSAVVLLVISLATSLWIEATLIDSDYSFAESKINYGLFVGHVAGRRDNIQVEMDLSMSCLWSENVCLMSCQADDDKRQQELQDLVAGKADSVCPNIAGSKNSSSPDIKFINAGIWVSCVLFQAVALLASVLTALFAFINVTTNPVVPIAGVFGLYVWNSIAVGSTALVMILWGVQFAETLSYNVAYSETITGIFKSEGQATLSMCYWFLISVLFLHIENLILLWVRQCLLDREPPHSRYGL